MSLAMYAAPFDDNNDSKNNEIDYITNKKKQAHSKTQKRYPKGNFDSEKVNNVLQQIHDNSNEDENGLGDFYPPPKPESIGAQRKKQEQNNIEQMGTISSNSDNNIQVLGKSPEPTYQNRSNDNLDMNNFSSNYGDNNTAEEYYKKMIPGYNQNPNKVPYIPSNSPHIQGLNSQGDNDLLIQKINYMINLLEEQQDEKTNNITEEVVLYSFLGIFIIFVVDSFAKVGKYVR